jgi:putative ABC transport system permease protein
VSLWFLFPPIDILRMYFNNLNYSKARGRFKMRSLEVFLQDLRFGVRMLLKKPSFTALAILTLALGIGANTAVFTLVNTVLLRPLPFKEPDRLAIVMQNLPRLNAYGIGVSPAEFLEYQANNEVFSEFAAFRTMTVNLTGYGEAERIKGSRVSAGLFPLLGVQPLYGRFFLPEEDQVGKDDVVILSRQLWQHHFGSDPGIVGKTVSLNGRPYNVVGIMPAQFQFPIIGTPDSELMELWVPMALTDEERSNHAGSFDSGLIGRLKPGVSLQQAEANIAAVATRFQQEHPDIYTGNVHVTTTVLNLEKQLTEKVQPFLMVLLGAVGLVLLIACANVANLLLGRAATRQKEMAIRSALGASSGRLIKQLLTESLLLALAGGGLGTLLALLTIDLIVKFGPGNVPRLQEASLDSSVLYFTLIVSVLTGILFGLAPAIQSSRLNLNEMLKEAGGRASKGREGRPLRATLVIFEVGSALILLVGAGLLINSFMQVLRVEPGFDPEGVLVARTSLPKTRYQKPEQYRIVNQQVMERLSALPGVQAVGVTSNIPLFEEWVIGFVADGQDVKEVRTANNATVSIDYFQVMKIPLQAGRTFTEQDRPGAPAVAIINETLARSVWPGENAIGKRIRWGGWGDELLTVVGVVADVKISGLDADTRSAIYLPLFQFPRPRMEVIYVVRTATDPGNLISSLRQEIRAVDQELPVYDIRTMNQLVTKSISQRRFSVLLLGMFAFTALLLAAIGLYGVISYSVTQRTHEIGIRMALGAQEKDVLKLVIGQGMTLTLIGLVIGLIGSFALTRLMKGLLFGVSASDPTTFALVASLLVAVALLACYIPARRAARVDPMIALRHE